jgi:hypothetical protein
MKRIGCFLLVLALSVMVGALPALGAESLTLVMSSATAQPGDTVTVTLNAKK